MERFENEKSWQKRIEQLEKVVAELQSALKQIHKEASIEKRNVAEKTTENISPLVDPNRAQAASAPSKVNQVSSKPLKSRESSEPADKIRKNEYWLNKIGIGLLLFGVAFLFKYSIDQGWLTPMVRVVFGLALGIVLLLLGTRIYANRKHFSRVLLGGGIATFYITGFAAFQLYALVSHPIAFAFMAAVTVVSFVFSLRQDEAILSLIGTLGGLGTPFLLYTGFGSLPALVGYTCVLLGGISAIYFYKGWLSLLWSSFVGIWLVFLIGLFEGLPSDFQEALGDRWALQLGMVFGWLVFWLVPVIREFFARKNPEQWPPFSVNFGGKFFLSKDRKFLEKYLNNHVHLLTVLTPLITLTLSTAVWSSSNSTWGWIAMASAVVYGLVSWLFFRLNTLKDFAYTHAFVGILFLTIAICLLLEGDTLIFALASEAGVLHLIAYRLSDKGVAVTAHLLFGFVGLWLVFRLLDEQTTGITAILNARAVTDFWIIGVASAVSILFKSAQEKKVYRFLAHIAFLGWLLRELSSLPNGQGYVTIFWGIYTIILLVVGLRYDYSELRTVAMGTLVVVVGKLFLVDLAELETIWRILLFLGFGALFLLLSYYFRAIWNPGSEPAD